MDTATKFESTDSPAARDDAAVWARKRAGKALPGRLEAQAADPRKLVEAHRPCAVAARDYPAARVIQRPRENVRAIFA
jgi:hypothetical protein